MTTDNASAGESRLKRLRDLPALEVDRDSIDVRGWDVDAPGGEPLGVVTDMLVDPDRLTAVYLIVDSGAESPYRPRPGAFLVPVNSARISPAARLVTTPLAVEELTPIPAAPVGEPHIRPV